MLHNVDLINTQQTLINLFSNLLHYNNLKAFDNVSYCAFTYLKGIYSPSPQNYVIDVLGFNERLDKFLLVDWCRYHRNSDKQ